MEKGELRGLKEGKGGKKAGEREIEKDKRG